MSKVIHLINDIESKNGGAQKLIRTLYIGLKNNDVEVELYSVCSIYQSLSGAKSLGAKSIYSIAAFLKVFNFIRGSSSQNIIHVHLFPTVFYVAICKKILRTQTQIYFTEHSTSNRRRGTVLGAIIDRFIYRSVDEVIAISDGTKQKLLKWQPHLKNNIRVVYNGIHLNQTNAKLKNLNSPIRILSVGRLTAAKNYINSIKAVKLINDAEVVYHIAGEGEMRGQIEELIRKEDLEGTVELLGFIDDVSLLMQKYDVFLQASLWEGFGLAIVEAMNESLPIVVSNVAGINEVAGDVAIYVDPNDPNDIARKIENLINSEELLRKNAKNAFDRSLKFNIEETVKMYQDIYKRNGQNS